MRAENNRLWSIICLIAQRLWLNWGLWPIASGHGVRLSPIKRGRVCGILSPTSILAVPCLRRVFVRLAPIDGSWILQMSQLRVFPRPLLTL